MRRHSEVCPVCLGKGQVSPNFYLFLGQFSSASNTATEKCRICDGTGVVYVPDDIEEIDAAVFFP